MEPTMRSTSPAAPVSMRALAWASRQGGPDVRVALPGLARSVRTHPGVTAKAEIGLVSDVFQSTDWLAGPGDDGAVVTDQGVSLVVGGEATHPWFGPAE